MPPLLPEHELLAITEEIGLHLARGNGKLWTCAMVSNPSCASNACQNCSDSSKRLRHAVFKSHRPAMVFETSLRYIGSEHMRCYQWIRLTAAGFVMRSWRISGKRGRLCKLQAIVAPNL